MARYFNTEGSCRPDRHYMVSLDERLGIIKEQFVDREKYFVMNRGRQYGKTTTLTALAEYLKEEYIVVFMDFQGIGSEEFVNAGTFVHAFAEEFLFSLAESAPEEKELARPLEEFAKDTADKSIREMFGVLSELCGRADRPIVLIIDEVDNASNNQVFIDFLSQLRRYYLARDRRPIFHSVILAGVYDIKNLKSKIRPDSERQYNSPWNIAADFGLDMNFSSGQIAEMLAAYEADHHTGMDIHAVADEIWQYTSGYPFLASAICKIMDETPDRINGPTGGGNVWTREGVKGAVQIILRTKKTLFDSMFKHISEYPELKQMFYAMLFKGERMAYNLLNHTMELACMFGYAVNDGVEIKVANRIFETLLYDLFLSEEELTAAMSRQAKEDRNQFIPGGRLDMECVMEKFAEHFQEIYGGGDEKFLENDGRRLFLLYLRPIINGTGHYYIEAQTRDERCTDVIVDYAGEQFVIEMKIWRGNEYHERGERQLADYLDYFHQDKGYMLSFNFNKKKETGKKTIVIGDKTIVETVV